MEEPGQASDKSSHSPPTSLYEVLAITLKTLEERLETDRQARPTCSRCSLGALWWGHTLTQSNWLPVLAFKVFLHLFLSQEWLAAASPEACLQGLAGGAGRMVH